MTLRACYHCWHKGSRTVINSIPANCKTSFPFLSRRVDETTSSTNYEVNYDNVRVPKENLLGPRGQGFLIAQRRLGPGRIFHCMRWLGQAQRAFDLMCDRLHSRETFGTPLAEKQLLQKFVFDSACEIQASRHLTSDPSSSRM